MGHDRLELGDPGVLGRLGGLDLPAALQVEHVGAVLEDGGLPAIDLAWLEPVLIAQV
jgi:hypothetical protein